jgi:GR25 family glycosyltransferase involved in LPS biosynthesis
MCQLLDKCFYINLDERADRNTHVISELKKIGINNCERVTAIKKNPGIIGCLYSHIKALEEGMKRNYEFITIFEDDVVFLNPEETLNKIKQVKNDKDWNVLLLGGMNNGGSYKKYKDLPCIRVSECMSCVAYVVKRDYAPKLLDVWKKSQESYEIQIKEKKCHIHVGKLAPDVSWLVLQKNDIFILLTPLLVSQLKGFSNCWNENVNHSRNMLSLEKEDMFEKNCVICKKDATRTVGNKYVLYSCDNCVNEVIKILKKIKNIK